MAVQPVEWVLVIYYGPSAHRATYGRLGNTKYTKDYIQLSRKASFLETVTRLFPVTVGEEGSVPLTYKWPKGTTPGTLVFNSADRPHLKWETSLGAPAAWKMSLSPSDATAETIPGDPAHTEFDAAENELAMLADRGAGQPYLIAIKLHNEPTTLHLRAYLAGPSDAYAWADLGILPDAIQELARRTSQNSALAWQTFASGGFVPTVEVKHVLSQLEISDIPLNELDGLDGDLGRGLAAYLRRPGYGLFFDPSLNHRSWVSPEPLSEKLASSAHALLEVLDIQYPATEQGDAAAESADPDPSEVAAFREKIEEGDYSVPDSSVTSKTRGSAQKAFAKRVKSNYDYRCAITGIETKDFLIASHIVPWSEDQSIRLDPCNGICLSVLMDRAFEKGHLVIEDDYTIRIDWAKIGDDVMLRSQLEPYDGKKLALPKKGAPQPQYLQRRRALFGSAI
ncbi:HNH endonuclease [Alcaligenes faecalis]|uniref:HNH endonuclease n=1 Tax=Alcaligenes faecalis TaxID=511 RepID=UPI0010CA46E1|nr:HNH endonuclease [Alcaligenes faecalis]QCP81933.1 HNH endonuclease [Alcaligenes faecalis]